MEPEGVRTATVPPIDGPATRYGVPKIATYQETANR
jgi:hypothetical protein